MQRRWQEKGARAGWVLALTAACASTSEPASPAQAVVQPAVEAPAPPEAADPMKDPDDYSGVLPPAAARAILVPSDPSEASPSATPVAPPSKSPNVVLVIGCTVRKDQISAYGGPAEATPFLGKLATEGVTFDDALAAAPWTRVASTAILTGKHAVNVGMVEPGVQRNNKRLPEELHTLGERFADAGYLTIGATGNPNLKSVFGFGQGYEHYQLGLPQTWNDKLEGKKIADAALKAIDDHGDGRPFFVRLMMLDAHAPRDAKESVYAGFQEPGVPARVARYRAHLRQFDDALSHLDSGLKSRGFDEDNTLFVVVADHGEGMNYPDPHGFGHGQYFGSSTVHIPWMLRGPGVAKGHRVLGLASQVDVLPTLLSLAGAPAQDMAQLDGQDHSAAVRGEVGRTARDHAISDTWFGGSNRAAIYTHKHQCQRDFGSTKKQQDKGKFVDGCTDRRTDPLGLEREEMPELTQRLIAWRGSRPGAISASGSANVHVDRELNRQLEALGYMEAPEEEGP